MTNGKNGSGDEGRQYRSRRLILKYFGIIYLPLIFGLAALAYLFHHAEFADFRTDLQSAEMKQVEVGREILDRDIATLLSDLDYLAARASQRLEAATDAGIDQDELMIEFYEFARTRKRFSTIHLMDGSGREILRADAHAAVSAEMPEILQRDWSGTEIFRRVSGLPLGSHMLHPPVCPNPNAGAADQDAAILMGAPVHADGAPAGALVVEYDSRALLEPVLHAEGVSIGQVMLLDSAGRSLLEIRRPRAWRDDFGTGRQDAFKELHPRAWAAISGKRNGTLRGDRGLFTFASFIARESPQPADSGESASPPGCWKIVSYVPSGILKAQMNEILREVGTVYALLVVLLAPGCLLMARAKVQSMRDRDKLMRLNASLNESVRGLERRNRETSLINRLSDFLQACRSEEEIFDVAARYAGNLIPGTFGAIYDLHETDLELVKVGQWGKNAGKQAFHQQECWAIRRGRPHFVGRPDSGHNCGHFDSGTPAHGYLCVPLIAHGKVTGLIHFQFEDGALDNSRQEREKARESFEQLAMTLADHIALSLANLRLRESLKDQSIRDALTGLYNRRHMEESLAREFSRAERHGQPVSLIMFDVDHFKRFNDEHGHEAGDLVLKELAAMLERSTRGEDIACRYGGEEFLVIMPGAPVDFAEKRAEELRLKVQDSLLVRQGEKRLGVTISLGVAGYPEHAADMDDALAKVDQALYAAKEAGRNKVVVAPAREPSAESSSGSS